MEKYPRIEEAEKQVSSARTKVLEAKKLLRQNLEKLASVYEEVFEEKVCKKNEFFASSYVSGFYRFMRVGIYSVELIYSPAKKDGTASKSERIAICIDNIIEEYSKKQE